MLKSKKLKKSSLSDEILKTLKCCLAIDLDHYADEALVLNCGGNACKKCVNDLNDVDSIKCNFCNQEHKKDEMNGRPSNILVKQIIKNNLAELEEKMLDSLKDVNERLKDENIIENMEIRFSNIEFELDTRIESIINSIHEYREDFMREMLEIKEKFKKKLNLTDLNEIKVKLESREEKKSTKRKKASEESSYEYFMETNKIINESKGLLNKYLNELNEIKFDFGSKFVPKEFVGELVVPLWKKLEFCNEMEFPYKLFESRFTYLKSQNQLIFTDDVDKDSALIILNLNSMEWRQFKHKMIKHPFSICVGKDDKIFINDVTEADEQILIFDKNLKFEAKFDFKYVAFNMKIDSSHQRNLLYISDYNDDKIRILNSENCQLINSIEIDSPTHIEFKDEFMFVLSYSTFSEDEITGELTAISGSNCVFILNKSNYENINKIHLDNWLQPLGIGFYNDNLLTIARELDENSIVSNKTYLHVINKENEIVHKVKVDYKNDGICDVIFFDDKLVLLLNDSVQIFKYA